MDEGYEYIDMNATNVSRNCHYTNPERHLINFTYPRSSIFVDLEYEHYIKIILYVIIIIGGLFGNISVIMTVAVNRSMRTTINYYVANLAIADSLICIFSMCAHFIGTLSDPIFAMGPFMCKFDPFMQMACLTSSVFTLCAISCDRFTAIMFPLQVRITKQRPALVMLVIWLLSASLALPFLAVKYHHTNEWIDMLETRCFERWPDSIPYFDEVEGRCVKPSHLQMAYYLVVCVVLYFLPVIIMISAYSLLLWRLWVSEVPGERHASNINVQSRARKKVIKMIVVVLVAFIICWTPFEVMLLTKMFESSSSSEAEDESEWKAQFRWASYYLAYANSFMNPIIYGGFNKTFREGFCIMLRCGIRRDRFNRPRSRLTFTTGVTSSPSRYASSRIANGAKSSSQKSANLEMKSVYCRADGLELSPMKNTCVTVADANENMSFA